ncbi:MAG: bestrophin family ion channel, partial [Parafilimonas sp.]
MRSYNPKEWKKIILDFHKSDTLRKLIPVLIAAGIYAFIIAFVELHYINTAQRDRLKNLTIIDTLLGFVLSLLLVFRTNTAYERW